MTREARSVDRDVEGMRFGRDSVEIDGVPLIRNTPPSTTTHARYAYLFVLRSSSNGGCII